MTMVPGSVPTVRLNVLLLKCKEADLAVEKANSTSELPREEAKIARAEFEATKLPDDRKAQAIWMWPSPGEVQRGESQSEDDINVRYAIAQRKLPSRIRSQQNANDHVSVRIKEPQRISLKCKDGRSRRREGQNTNNKLLPKRQTSPRPNSKRPKLRPLISDK